MRTLASVTAKDLALETYSGTKQILKAIFAALMAAGMILGSATPANASSAGQFCAVRRIGEITTARNGNRIQCVREGNRARWRNIGSAPARPSNNNPPANNTNVTRSFTVVGSPRINGSMRVGSTVEVVGRNNAFSPTPTSFRHQWLRNGNPIPDANGQTYTIRNADAGQTITVRVTAVRSGVGDLAVTTTGRTVTG